MKIFGLTIVALAVLFGQVNSSADEARSTTEYEMLHQLGETERQAVVAANIVLGDAEAEPFWSLYREYRGVTKSFDDRRLALVSRFATNFGDMTDEQGARMVSDALKLERERQAAKRKHLKRFARVLHGQRLFRYYQIETKLDAIYRFGWTREIPLARVEP